MTSENILKIRAFVRIIIITTLFCVHNIHVLGLKPIFIMVRDLYIIKNASRTNFEILKRIVDLIKKAFHR